MGNKRSFSDVLLTYAGILLIIAMIVGIVALGIALTKDLYKIPEEMERNKQTCENLGATWIPEVFGKCYDYDSEGYRFYWKLDREGRLYKTRG